MSPTDIPAYMTHLGVAARAAATAMAASSTAARNAALGRLAARLRDDALALQAANAIDLDAARAARPAAPLLDRLKLDARAIETVAAGYEELAAMPDPIGEITRLARRPSGIAVGQMRVPLGVFGMIYESRPNVTIEAASLAIKSGNAAILRGGSEALRSNLALWQRVQAALGDAGLNPDAVQLVQTTDRAEVGLDLAVKVTDNAKTQKVSPCNAAESLLVHAAQAGAFLPRIGAVFAAKDVEMRCCPASRALLAGVAGARVVAATEADWAAEYLATIISVKVVASLDEAIAHVNRCGSHHTDAILTSNHAAAMRFLREVDSASVMVNASTRFADGFEYGLGAEIGISTDKFHARGPVGLEGLTSLKWVVLGQGEVRT